MLQNYKKDFKPYFTGLRQDNNKLKEFFNTDSFILEVREQAKKKIAAAINPSATLVTLMKISYISLSLLSINIEYAPSYIFW